MVSTSGEPTRLSPRRLPCVAALTAACLASSPMPAFAQAAVPVGFWSTADGYETFQVSANGYCDFQATQPETNLYTHVVGQCWWQSSSNGGIMTIMNTTNYKPAPIYENIVWVNSTTITIWGDVFYRR